MALFPSFSRNQTAADRGVSSSSARDAAEAIQARLMLAAQQNPDFGQKLAGQDEAFRKTAIEMAAADKGNAGAGHFNKWLLEQGHATVDTWVDSAALRRTVDQIQRGRDGSWKAPDSIPSLGQIASTTNIAIPPALETAPSVAAAPTQPVATAPAATPPAPSQAAAPDPSAAPAAGTAHKPPSQQPAPPQPTTGTHTAALGHAIASVAGTANSPAKLSIDANRANDPAAVMEIQKRINADLPDDKKIKEDGKFGPQTDAAVREWQKNNGIRADGSVGPETLQKMAGEEKIPELDKAAQVMGAARAAVGGMQPVASSQSQDAAAQATLPTQRPATAGAQR